MTTAITLPCLLTFDIFESEDDLDDDNPCDTFQRWVWLPFMPMEDMDLQFTEPEEFVIEVDSAAWCVDEGYAVVHCTDIIADDDDRDEHVEDARRRGWTRVEPGSFLGRPEDR